MTSVAEILDRAADRLEQPGAWCQGVHSVCDWPGRTVQECVETAIDRCLTRDVECYLVTDQLRKVIGTSFIWKWNDAPGRTQAEVVAALREAARRARGDDA